jgi:hypothetical protein
LVPAPELPNPELKLLEHKKNNKLCAIILMTICMNCYKMCTEDTEIKEQVAYLCGGGLELRGSGDEDCLALSESESPNSEEDEAPLLLP